MKKNFLPEELNLVKAAIPYAEVSFTRNGNIRILNPHNDICQSYWRGGCKKWYVIGFSSEGFWIRRVSYSTKYHETASTYPLHYNRTTCKYYFDTFNEALTYFLTKVNTKKINF